MLRKSAKNLMYDLRVVKPFWNRKLKDLHQNLQRSTELLGDANDLEMLSDYLRTLNMPSIEPVLGRIRARQRALWIAADRLSLQLFDASEQTFAKLLHEALAVSANKKIKVRLTTSTLSYDINCKQPPRNVLNINP